MTGDKDFDELLQRCFDILKTKSADYAEDGDRLAEFRETSKECGISMRQTLGVYMNKHLRSVKKWVRGEQLKGEPVEEKLLDIIVYCLLGYKMLKEERYERKEIERALTHQIPDDYAIYGVMPAVGKKKTVEEQPLSPEMVDEIKRRMDSIETTKFYPAEEVFERVRNKIKKVHADACCDGSLSDGTPCGRKFDHDGICIK